MTALLATGLLAQVYGMPTGLISLAILFFIIAIVAYVLGAQGAAGLSAGIGRTLLFVFLVLAVLTILASFMHTAV